MKINCTCFHSLLFSIFFSKWLEMVKKWLAERYAQYECTVIVFQTLIYHISASYFFPISWTFQFFIKWFIHSLESHYTCNFTFPALLLRFPLRKSNFQPRIYTIYANIVCCYASIFISYGKRRSKSYPSFHFFFANYTHNRI